MKSVGLETEESLDLEMQAGAQLSSRGQNWAIEVDQAAKDGESKEWWAENSIWSAEKTQRGGGVGTRQSATAEMGKNWRGRRTR